MSEVRTSTLVKQRYYTDISTILLLKLVTNIVYIVFEHMYAVEFMEIEQIDLLFQLVLLLNLISNLQIRY